MSFPPPCTDLTLNRKSFERGGGRGALLPCEESGLREGEVGWAGPGLGITYQGPRTPNQPCLDSLAPASAYLPQTATRAPRCSPSTSAPRAPPPSLLTSLQQHQPVTPLKTEGGAGKVRFKSSKRVRDDKRWEMRRSGLLRTDGGA